MVFVCGEVEGGVGVFEDVAGGVKGEGGGGAEGSFGCYGGEGVGGGGVRGVAEVCCC